jgi:signal peptidase II
VTWFWYGLSISLVLLDQWTKQLALQHFKLGQLETVTPFFDLTLAFNRGAAFSFLSDAGGWQRWFFTGISASVSAVLVVWLWRLGSRQRLLALGLSLVLGGAIGNLIDRVALGYVVDFISLHYRDYYWPAFNIADSAITCGAVLLFIDIFKGQGEADEANVS